MRVCLALFSSVNASYIRAVYTPHTVTLLHISALTLLHAGARERVAIGASSISKLLGEGSYDSALRLQLVLLGRQRLEVLGALRCTRSRGNVRGAARVESPGAGPAGLALR